LPRSLEFVGFPAPDRNAGALGFIPPSEESTAKRRDSSMRFLVRSAFWLGLTFHAMPWGDAKLSDALPDAAPAVVRLAVASATGDSSVGALARGALRGALDLDAPAAAKPQRASLDTLSTADRAPPWRGPLLRSSL